MLYSSSLGNTYNRKKIKLCIFYLGFFVLLLGVSRAIDQLLVFSDLLPKRVGPVGGSSSMAGTCTVHNLR